MSSPVPGNMIFQLMNKTIVWLQNYAVTETVHKVAESFKCKPIEGMLSHQLKQFKIDGEKTIIQNPNEAQRKEHEKCEFELHEVYAIDVLVSSGEGIVSLCFLNWQYNCCANVR